MDRVLTTSLAVQAGTLLLDVIVVAGLVLVALLMGNAMLHTVKNILTTFKAMAVSLVVAVAVVAVVTKVGLPRLDTVCEAVAPIAWAAPFTRTLCGVGMAE